MSSQFQPGFREQQKAVAVRIQRGQQDPWYAAGQVRGQKVNVGLMGETQDEAIMSFVYWLKHHRLASQLVMLYVDEPVGIDLPENIQVQAPFQQQADFFSAGGQQPVSYRAPVSVGGPRPTSEVSEVEELKARVAELTALIAQLAPLPSEPSEIIGVPEQEVENEEPVPEEESVLRSKGRKKKK